MPHQILKNGEFLRREVQQPGGPADLASRGVKHQVTDGERGRLDRGRPAADRLDPGEQFLEGKRFGDVVIGAGPERLDLVIHRVLRGEDQNRSGDPAVADGPEHFVPGHPGKPEVENHEIVVTAGNEPKRLQTVLHQIGVIALLLEPALDVLADDPVVLDHQDLHAITVAWAGRITEKTLPRPSSLWTSIRPP